MFIHLCSSHAKSVVHFPSESPHNNSISQSPTMPPVPSPTQVKRPEGKGHILRDRVILEMISQRMLLLRLLWHTSCFRSLFDIVTLASFLRILRPDFSSVSVVLRVLFLICFPNKLKWSALRFSMTAKISHLANFSAKLKWASSFPRRLFEILLKPRSGGE